MESKLIKFLKRIKYFFYPKDEDIAENLLKEIKSDIKIKRYNLNEEWTLDTDFEQNQLLRNPVRFSFEIGGFPVEVERSYLKIYPNWRALGETTNTLSYQLHIDSIKINCSYKIIGKILSKAEFVYNNNKEKEEEEIFIKKDLRHYFSK